LKAADFWFLSKDNTLDDEDPSLLALYLRTQNYFSKIPEKPVFWINTSVTLCYRTQSF